MMKGTLAALAVLLAAPGTLEAAPADDETTESRPSAEATDAQDEPAEERKICRTEKATGSLTRRTRICLTAAQWREVNDRTRRGVDEMNSGASGGKMCVPDPADPYQGCS